MSLTILAKTKWTLISKYGMFHQPGDNSLKPGIIDDTLHGVGFPTGGLTICKDGSIVAREDICKQRIRPPLTWQKPQTQTYLLLYFWQWRHTLGSESHWASGPGIWREISAFSSSTAQPYLVEHVHFARNGDTLIVRARWEFDDHFWPCSFLCVIEWSEPEYDCWKNDGQIHS